MAATGSGPACSLPFVSTKARISVSLGRAQFWNFTVQASTFVYPVRTNIPGFGLAKMEGQRKTRRLRPSPHPPPATPGVLGVSFRVVSAEIKMKIL